MQRSRSPGAEHGITWLIYVQQVGERLKSGDVPRARRIQVYRVDEQGVVHWTDRSETVPRRYREEAKPLKPCRPALSAPLNLGLKFNGCYDDSMMPLIRGRLGRSLLALLYLGTIVAPLAAEGAADDLKVVDGVLSQPLLLPDHHIAEIATDSGATYYVDLRALPRNQVRLQAQTAVTVVGYEGDRPDVISAHKLKVREIRPSVPLNGAMVMVRVAGSSARFISGEMVRVLGVLGRDKTFTASVLIVLSPLQSDVRANKTRNDP